LRVSWTGPEESQLFNEETKEPQRIPGLLKKLVNLNYPQETRHTASVHAGQTSVSPDGPGVHRRGEMEGKRRGHFARAG